jgi:hypothetical protein
MIHFHGYSESISLNGGLHMSFASDLVFLFVSAFISTAAMGTEPFIRPCLTQAAPPNVSRIKSIHGVLDVVVNANNKNIISAFIDNGDVARLEASGCNNGIVVARLWMGDVGYVMDSGDNAVAPLEKNLIQRAKIVTRMVFQDKNEIARIDGLMDGGHFLPKDRNRFKEFSARDHDFGMEIQQVSGGPSEALITIYYFNPPMVNKK